MCDTGSTYYSFASELQVFVWEDQDDDTVSEYRTFEGHKEDILCMAACPGKQLLATGK
jgi:hypothetical protein